MSVISETQNVLSSMARAGEARGRDNTQANREANEDAEQRFLKLLTTQLQNQDPMNPMENAEVTSQLAQMSMVDGIERLNSMFQQLMNDRSETEAMRAAELVGRGVLVPGKNMVLTEAGGMGGFELRQPAEEVTLTIKDSSGLQVAEIELDELDEGSHNYVWDGTTVDGSAAAPGMYTVSVSAKSGGEEVGVNALEFGEVTGVIKGAQSTDLQLGNRGIFKFEEVKQIL